MPVLIPIDESGRSLVIKMSSEGSKDQASGSDGSGGGGASKGKVGGSSSDGEQQHSGFNPMETLEQLMRLLRPWQQADEDEEAAAKPEQLLEDVTLEGVVKYMQSNKSAGIPDFRSPGTGLYDNLEKYNLPEPMAIFDIHYFMERPEPFFYLAKELYPGKFRPTPSHYFIRLLADKKILLRNYTQNIDTLERIAGVPGDLMVEAHGTFHTGHCIGKCGKEYTQQWMKDEIFADRLPKCTECEGLVKPDIVFFGESLPMRFSKLVMEDFPKCDLLIVMGTSLVVHPFASLIERVPVTTPRLLINKEKAGEGIPRLRQLGMDAGGFDFESKDKYRDVAYLGTCDDGCYKLAEMLGWKDDLDKLIKSGHEQIDGQSAASQPSKKPSEGETDQAEPSTKAESPSKAEAASK
ncbi:NAD-dependent protein deacetylase sirtuin-2-like isoform X2 [Patiria miniata]|uniref:Deacetylase sirtuin-type domain-containing protein n=1 Tax=Patiria miniata TaxID=46514 RepID=A0A914BAP9_PATMI|nr:NAD-dependent protein deacetylase sirtuin-2-like isoform X2 [Patiria miniata]